MFQPCSASSPVDGSICSASSVDVQRCNVGGKSDCEPPSVAVDVVPAAPGAPAIPATPASGAVSSACAARLPAVAESAAASAATPRATSPNAARLDAPALGLVSI